MEEKIKEQLKAIYKEHWSSTVKMTDLDIKMLQQAYNLGKEDQKKEHLDQIEARCKVLAKEIDDHNNAIKSPLAPKE